MKESFKKDLFINLFMFVLPFHGSMGKVCTLFGLIDLAYFAFHKSCSLPLPEVTLAIIGHLSIKVS
jgi:hypothetical protein